MLICAMIGSGYFYVVVQEIKNKIETSKIRETISVQRESKLEEEALVRRKELSEYLLFTSSSPAELLSKYISEGKISENKSTFNINENILLPSIRANNCRRNLCIQQRLDFSEIPSSTWKALLGTEDFRFLEHRGVDPFAIARAIVVDIIAMKFVQGGSTLTQQLVKNLFLTNEKKLSRKLKEMVYALYIENVLSKEKIVSLYLNEVFWGTYQGIYLKGINAASLAYFKKSPNELNDFEGTILISFLKGPNYYNPRKSYERIKARSNAVFKRLKSLNLVGEESTIWTEEQWRDWQAQYNKNSGRKYLRSYYYLTKNRERQLEGFEKFVFYNSVERVKKLLKTRIKGIDIGVKALISSKECKSYDCENVFSFYSKHERDKRSAITNEYHQVGSMLKPIVYDSFIDLGRKYDESISTKPLTIKLKSGSWKPKDYSKAKGDEITLKRALQKSKNIPLIRVASEIGFDELEKELDNKFPRLKKPLADYPAQLLGAIELSMSEVLTTYSNFIEQKCEQVKREKLDLEDSVLYFMGEAAQTTVANLAYGQMKNANVFGKTGTSNKGFDNWYFAFDGNTYYVIWFGVDSNRTNKSLRLTGGASSFRILQDFLNYRGKLISEVTCVK